MTSHKIVIIEDEPPAAQRLVRMLNKINPNLEILEILDSVESAVEYFRKSPIVDLILMDIQLGDGISFEIFAQSSISCPVIFTTAYDEYSKDTLYRIYRRYFVLLLRSRVYSPHHCRWY